MSRIVNILWDERTYVLAAVFLTLLEYFSQRNQEPWLHHTVKVQMKNNDLVYSLLYHLQLISSWVYKRSFCCYTHQEVKYDFCYYSLQFSNFCMCDIPVFPAVTPAFQLCSIYTFYECTFIFVPGFKAKMLNEFQNWSQQISSNNLPLILLSLSALCSHLSFSQFIINIFPSTVICSFSDTFSQMRKIKNILIWNCVSIHNTVTKIT